MIKSLRQQGYSFSDGMSPLEILLELGKGLLVTGLFAFFFTAVYGHCRLWLWWAGSICGEGDITAAAAEIESCWYNLKNVYRRWRLL